MNPDLLDVARELNLLIEYKTIRVSTGEVVKVEEQISSKDQLILERAYKAGLAKQKWATLTDAELDYLHCSTPSWREFARAVESQLKEKNT